MPITLTGLSHKSAPVEIRERLAIVPGETPAHLLSLRESLGLEECALIATCNRMEVYVRPKPGVQVFRSGTRAAGDGVQADPPGGPPGFAVDGPEHPNTRTPEHLSACPPPLLQFLAAQAGVSEERLRPHLYCLDGTRAVRHLFRVAAGLDSMVMGESQVLSQVKDALSFAQSAGTAGGVLHGLLRRAIETGKRVRTETEIARGAVSISWAAVQLSQQIFGRAGSKTRTALLVGAGETGERTARLLLAEGIAARLLVCNRTWDRAAELAGSLGGEAIPFERLSEALTRADLVITSTGAQQPIMTRAMLRQTVHARRGRAIFLIDIAVPRDVEPEAGDLDDLFLYNIDDLQAVVDKSLELRQSEVERVDAIVEEEVQRFQAWLRTQEVAPTIGALQRHAELIRSAEMEQLRARLSHLSPEDYQQVEAAMRGMVNKLLHRPMVHLRTAAASGNGYHEVESVRALFGLEDEVKR